MKPAARRIVCAMVLTSAVSCATFSERPPFPRYTGPPEPIPVRLRIEEVAKLDVGWDDWIDHPGGTPGLAEWGGGALLRSQWVRLAPDPGEADVLWLWVGSRQNRGPGLFSLGTLFAIPGFIDHGIQLQLTLRPGTDREMICRREIVMRTWYQTLLILFYPFKSPEHYRLKSVEALSLDCLAELLQSEAAAAPGPSDEGDAEGTPRETPPPPAVLPEHPPAGERS